MEKKIYEMQLDDLDSGVFAVSFVDSPAIEKNFVALAKEDVQLAISEEKRIVTGPILIPDKKILRMGADGIPYDIFFSKDTVEKISQKYLSDHNQDKVTLQHNSDVEDVVLVETWLKSDSEKDKSVSLGIDVPVGTWLGSFKVNNETVWNEQVKTGKVKGFSIEGLFKTKEVKMESKTILQEIKETITNLFKEHTAPAPEPVEEVVMEEEAPVEEAPSIEERVMALEDMVAEILAKLTPKDEEAPVEAAAVEVVEEEVVEAAAEEEVEMVKHTDYDEPKYKKVKFDRKLTTQERIKQQLGILN